MPLSSTNKSTKVRVSSASVNEVRFFADETSGCLLERSAGVRTLL